MISCIRVARFRLLLCQFPRDYAQLLAKAEISAAEEPSVTAWPCARTTSGASAARASGPPKRPVRFSWERPRQARDNNLIVYTCQRMTLTSNRERAPSTRRTSDCPSKRRHVPVVMPSSKIKRKTLHRHSGDYTEL